MQLRRIEKPLADQLRAILGITLLVLLVLQGTAVRAQVPAFPGAEGAGKDAVGGRHGDVYRVTNLNDSGSGSFRFGVDNAPSSGRTIVFEVGGTIDLASRIRINSPNVTVAGQTAPGGGITLKGYHLEIVDTQDIVVRYLRVRPGDINTAPNDYQPDSLSIRESSGVVIDHVSVSWSTDENLSTTHDSNDVSVQWSLITEALHDSNHNKGNHGYGSLINGGDYSFHHNLYADNRSRNPRPGQGGSNPTRLDFVNNVIYNPGNKFGYGGDDTMFLNFAGNYGIAGPDTNETDLFDGDSVSTEIYQSGNFMDLNEDGSLNGTNGGWSDFGGTFTQNNGPRFDLPLVTTQTAAQAVSSVLAHAGASVFRDAADTRIIDDAQSYGTSGAHIDSQSEVGSWPALPAGTAPTDTDNDGMPDDWELDHGLNPNSSSDRTGDFDLDGYINLEEYLNDMGAFPATAPLVFNGGSSNRYAEIDNWGPVWQPSRFDLARIHSGTVEVDAVGQHAGTLELGPNASDNATLNVSSGWIKVADDLEVGSASGTGNLAVSSGASVETTNVNVNALGTLSGGGDIVGDVSNFGLVSPGASIDTLSIDGDLTQDASGILLMEIDSLVSFDQLDISGMLIAGGTLGIDLNYTPSVGHSYDLLDFSSASGAWFVDLPALGGGMAWDTDDLLTTGVLSVVSGVPVEDADFDESGTVDGTDFLIWLRNFNTAGGLAQGDANSSGFVDNADLVIWENQYGLLVADSAAVPEPSTAVLMLLTSASLVIRRANRV